MIEKRFVIMRTTKINDPSDDSISNRLVGAFRYTGLKGDLFGGLKNRNEPGQPSSGK